MTISVDWKNGVIESDSSISDISLFHASLRSLEDDVEGVIYPKTHKWKALDLGGGAFFYQMDLDPYYVLKFPNAGNYTITGNMNGTITPVAGVYVERKTSSAYTTTAIGGSGPTAAEIAAELLSGIQNAIVPVNLVKVRGQTIGGSGTENDPWGP